MDDADGQVLETLVIMFTVVTVGLVVIIGTSIPKFNRHVLSVLAAFWAWGLIAVKRFYFWGQRNGRDHKFTLMEIHVSEISTSVMLLLLMWLNNNAQDNKSPSKVSVQLFLVGLIITGFGMGMCFSGPSVMSVFFPGDLGFYFIAIGLSVISGGYGRDEGRFGPLIVYTLVLLAATYIAGDIGSN